MFTQYFLKHLVDCLILFEPICLIRLLIIFHLPMQPAGKKKYNITDFLAGGRSNPIIRTYSLALSCLSCVCGQFSTNRDTNGLTCLKCGSFVHACLARHPNRGSLYECAGCVNRGLDPLFQVKRILVESYFRTQNIFEYHNIISFEFTVTQQEIEGGVEVRGLMPCGTALNWPMQGGFYLNDETVAFHELKPLIANSNRKARREEYFPIPKEKIQIGRNFLRFKIPCIDRAKFTARYQFEEKKVYYLAVNAIQRLSITELQSQTFRERRCEKQDSLKLLNQDSGDIEVTGSKICLICPYTRDRIKIPVRGKHCKHFSCVCLLTMVATHANSRYWNCPLCDEKLCEPYVDLWVYSMLRDNQIGSQVIVNQDGTYSWIATGHQAMDLDSSEEDSTPRPLNLAVAITEAKQIITSQPNPQTQKNEIVELEIIDEVIEHPLSQVLEQPLLAIIEKASHISPLSESPVIDLIDLDVQIPEPNKKEMSKKQFMKKLTTRVKEAVKKVVQPTESKSPDSSLSLPAKDRPKSVDKFDRYIPPRPSNPILFDVRTIELKELKAEEWRRFYFKGRCNPFKKWINNDQMRKLFKEIL